MATKKVQPKPTVKKKRKKKAQQNNKRIFLFIAEMVILVILLVVLYMVLKADKVNKISIDKENIVCYDNKARFVSVLFLCPISSDGRALDF